MNSSKNKWIINLKKKKKIKQPSISPNDKTFPSRNVTLVHFKRHDVYVCVLLVYLNDEYIINFSSFLF